MDNETGMEDKDCGIVDGDQNGKVDDRGNGKEEEKVNMGNSPPSTSLFSKSPNQNDLISANSELIPITKSNILQNKNPESLSILANYALRSSYERVAIKNKDKIAKALVNKAIKGDVPAIKELGDRIMGKSIEQVQVSVVKILNVDI